MDPVRFDRLAKSLSAPETRRRVFGVLAAVPVVGGLLGIFSPEETDAAGRRKRRKTRNTRRSGDDKKNRKGKHKKKKPQCAPESVAQTCAGTCGRVTNNCQQTVDCGSCTCTPACDVCFTCQDGPNTPGTCVVDPAQQGEACGSGGKVCQSDGTCTCIPLTACPAEKVCGTISDGCGGTVRCPFICINPTPICTDNVCEACTSSGQCASDERCCNGQCVSGVCCMTDECAAQPCQTVSCTGNQCVYDNAANGTRCCPSCATGTECQDGQCVCAPDCTGKCGGADNGCGGTCTGSCGTNQVCDAGMCKAYDVCASGCAFRTVQAAINAAASGATIRIGPGTYTRDSEMGAVAHIDRKSLTLIGAGSGVGGTVLDGGGQASEFRVVFVYNTVAELRHLKVTGGKNQSDLADAGGGIISYNGATTTLTGVVVTGNTASLGGGIYNGSTLILNAGTVVTGNTATNGAGGIVTDGALILNAGSAVTGNTAEFAGGIFNQGTVTLNAGSAVTGNTASFSGGILNQGGTVIRDPESDVSGNDPDDCNGC